MSNLYQLFLLLFLLLSFNRAICQQTDDENPNTPKFKMTKWSQPEECKGKGSNFETGYVSVPQNDHVTIILFFQKIDV